METISTKDRLGAYLEMEASGGKIFTVIFVKKDGSRREMNCRMGVTKGVKGTGIKVSNARKRKGFIPVYDVKKNAWRSINLYTLKELKINRRTILVLNII
jgi:hypothetical protein